MYRSEWPTIRRGGAMKRDCFLVIVGCGRLGAALARRASGAGDSVVVIDRDPSAFAALSDDFSGFRIEGDATELSTLREAKLGRANTLYATTARDAVNLMVAQVARALFGVERVVARVADPRRAEIYASRSIETVCTTSLAADLFFAQSESGPTGQGKGTSACG